MFLLILFYTDWHLLFSALLFRMSNSSSPNPPSASLLCQSDESSANPLPAICHQIFTNYMDKLKESLKNNSTNGVESEIMETDMFLEILKHFVIFVGMCASLPLLTVVICHRPRKIEVTNMCEYSQAPKSWRA